MRVCQWLTQCIWPKKPSTQICPDLSLSIPEPTIHVECLNGVLPSSHKGKTVYRKRTKIYSLSSPHRSLSRAPSVALSLLIQPKRALIRRVLPSVPRSALVSSSPVSEDFSLTRSYTQGDVAGLESDLKGQGRGKK